MTAAHIPRPPRSIVAWPSIDRADVLFSVKTFASGMLAMYLANRAGLPRPFWALATTYIVANPLAGAVRSKALFRFIGTLVGSTAAVLLVPALSNAPVLLTLALALWVGACLYASLLDRTPRAYVFMLSGYTAALIGFPSVQAPLLVFDTTVARVEEIGLAILCATAVHAIVLPTSLAPSLLGLLDRTLADGRQWLLDLLRPRAQSGPSTDASPTAPNSAPADPRRLAADRRRLAADITQLRILSTHVPFDTSHLRWTAGALRTMQDRVAALTPTLSSVEDRLRALEAADGTQAPDIAASLEAVGHWLRVGQPSAGSSLDDRLEAQAAQWPAVIEAIRRIAAPEAAEARSAAKSSWDTALRIGLASGLTELVEGWRACALLRREIDDGIAGKAPGPRSAALGNRVLHRDHGMAALSALAAVIAIGICSAFWILTGWPSGSVAAMMAAVFCSFFAAMDDPVPAIHGFLKWTLLSFPPSALYVLVLMPLVNDFGMLVAITAPVFLIGGIFIARPATTGAALAFTIGIAGTLALHDTANADIAGFINSNLGQVAGLVAAARVTRLVRSVGADWSARRIQRAIWRELGEMAGRHSAPGDSGYAVRMLDRIGLLAPRIALDGGSADAAVADDALRDLRVGVDIATLQRTRPHLPTEPTDRVLAALAAFFRNRGRGLASTWSPRLLSDIDTSLGAMLRSPGASPEWRAAVAALVGLRRNVFPQAPIGLSIEPGAAT